MERERLVVLRGLSLGLVFLVLATLLPLWLPLLLAAWTADLVEPVVARLEKLLRGRRRSAAFVVALLAFGLILPAALVGGVVVAEVRHILAEARVALEGDGSLAKLVGGTTEGVRDVEQWAALVRRYGPDAWQAAATVARASARTLLAMLVYAVAVFAFSVDGGRAYTWAERTLPIDGQDLRRFAAAFRETGRGLVVGAGGTALAQGCVATVAYLALGVPRAFVLGALTTLCALVPFVGTALIWAPTAVGLALGGDVGRAVALAVLGVAVVGTMDNVLRPFLTRFGKLQLPGSVVLIAVVGGVGAFGPTGALVGPLVVRLAVEALAILRERRSRL